MAANRSTWASCCEQAIFIHTGAHCRKTYHPRETYLSRLRYMNCACERLMNGEHDFLLEASDMLRDGITDLSTLSFSEPAGATASASLSSVAKPVDKS